MEPPEKNHMENDIENGLEMHLYKGAYKAKISERTGIYGQLSGFWHVGHVGPMMD